MTESIRARVLAVVEAAPEPLRGLEVAVLAGVGYMQALYALNALLNHEKITRIGRKSAARWVRNPAPDKDPGVFSTLHCVFHTNPPESDLESTH